MKKEDIQVGKVYEGYYTNNLVDWAECDQNGRLIHLGREGTCKLSSFAYWAKFAIPVSAQRSAAADKEINQAFEELLEDDMVQEDAVVMELPFKRTYEHVECGDTFLSTDGDFYVAIYVWVDDCQQHQLLNLNTMETAEDGYALWPQLSPVKLQVTLQPLGSRG